MRATMTRPIQKPEKFPAVSPERTFSDAPPSRLAVTTSFTWRDDVEVKTFTTSGMIAPASVPNVMIVESFHHSVPSPRSAMRSRETTNVRTTETIEVSHTSVVSGSSKFITDALPHFPFAHASFRKYDPTDAMTIMMRIAKIQTSSDTWFDALGTARRMKLMSATPVTP